MRLSTGSFGRFHARSLRISESEFSATSQSVTFTSRGISRSAAPHPRRGVQCNGAKRGFTSRTISRSAAPHLGVGVQCEFQRVSFTSRKISRSANSKPQCRGSRRPLDDLHPIWCTGVRSSSLGGPARQRKVMARSYSLGGPENFNSGATGTGAGSRHAPRHW